MRYNSSSFFFRRCVFLNVLDADSVSHDCAITVTDVPTVSDTLLTPTSLVSAAESSSTNLSVEYMMICELLQIVRL